MKNIVKSGLNVASPVASVFVFISPAFLAVPIITSIFNEICEYFDRQSTEKRLGMLECALNEKNIQVEKFQELVNQLDEHDIYAFWHISYFSTEDKRRIRKCMRKMRLRRYALYSNIEKCILNI